MPSGKVLFGNWIKIKIMCNPEVEYNRFTSFSGFDVLETFYIPVCVLYSIFVAYMAVC